jgi:hypothetical protein
MGPFHKAGDIWCYAVLLVPLLSMGANVLSQIMLVRARHGRKFFRSVVEGFAVGGTTLVTTQAILSMWRPSVCGTFVLCVLVNMPLYGCLSCCYFGLANLGQSSIRVRIYAELASEASGVSRSELLQRYDEGVLMNVRIRRLVESGDLIERGGRYYVGRARLVLLGKFMTALKTFMLGKGSQFD